MTRPRLLYLGHNLPYPPHEGALIRSYHTVRLLAREFDLVGLYFFRRGALPTEASRATALEQMEVFGEAHAVPIDQEWSWARLLWDHGRSVITGQAYTRWTYESKEARQILERLIRSGSFDVVHVDSLDLVPYLPLVDRQRLVLAHHNVESSLLRRRAVPEKGLKRRYIEYQAGRVERLERQWCGRVALNVVVSADDQRVFEQLSPAGRYLVIPNGVDTNEFQPSVAKPSADIVFVGGYSWFPNTDGMEFFARQILPLIRQRVPEVSVRWVGRAPDAAVEEFARLGVEMTGYVDDIRPFVHGARCVIVPLRVGGGTRLKILDAWAMGKAVVSTSRGCEGLETEHESNILIANEPESFAKAVTRVLGDGELRGLLGENARHTAVRVYDWDRLGEVMTGAYRMLL